MSDKKTAVILFQLGGPDSLQAVEPFLYNLFCDSDIFNYPLAFLLRKPIAKIISSMRARSVQHHYITIGGKSPILELTKLQADALETELRKEINAKVYIGMRYSNPDIKSVVQSLSIADFEQVILLPLYPQYSTTTTGSSFNEWKRRCNKYKFDPRCEKLIHNFHDHPLYIEALTNQINLTLAKFKGIPSKDIHLIFSAHGIPESIIEAGDPYKDQIEKTYELILKKGGWDCPSDLCYQSKVGPLKWVKPSLTESVTRLAETATRYMLVVPVSFVCDNLETLQEIDIQTRRTATELGVKQFEMMPALNANATFISALKELVLNTALA